MSVYRSILVVVMSGALMACDPSPPQNQSGSNNVLQTADFTLSQSEFDELPADTQYMLANKALSTMYRGLPLDEFFDLTQGLENPVVQQANFISNSQIALQTPLESNELTVLRQRLFGVEDTIETTDVDESIPARFTIDDNHPHQYYMARIQTYPLSQDMFVSWMSYFLANTIMFSPAREMDSTNSQDITRVLGYLEKSLREKTAIRDVVRGWMHNLSRWRVSRSPENHALEMFELYLGVFNDTAEEQQNTENGGIVCDSWMLTDNDADYQLLPDPVKPEGTQALKVFGKYVSTCDELYDVVAGHPLLIPRVVEVIVNYFLDGAPGALKTQLIQDISSTGPTTFDDVFLAVIYSEAFLLQAERPKTFEETTFGFLHAMHWTPRANSGNLDERTLDIMLDSTNNNSSMAVHNMGWAAMDSKIGRTPFVPMDALSFATYHKGVRESVLLQQRAFDGCQHPSTQYKGCRNKRTDQELDEFEGLPYPQVDGAFYEAGTENLKPQLENLTATEFVDFIFLTALGRRAETDEMDALLNEAGEDIRDELNVIVDDNRDYIREDEDGVLQLRKTDGEDLLWENRTDDFAEVILDYISRLPEFYYYKAVN
jgi:hypothetical protein